MTVERKRPPPGWKKGQSGNPKGRPRGVGPVNLLRAAIAARVPDILAKLIEQALEGDTGAARLLLERAIAPLKAAEQTQALSLPDGPLTQQGRAVLACVAAGELAPSQGAALLGAIGQLAKISEVDELAARITKLEESQNAKS